MSDTWHPMLEVEQKHKISFNGCLIHPKENEEWDDDADGILRFDGYAIVPRDYFEELERKVGALRGV